MGKREDYISKMGYRDDSPFNKRKFIDINTPNGVIDMSKSGRTLRATDSKGKTKVLKPYSGQHQFAPGTVREELIEEEFDEVELTDEEIKELRDGGYVVEELPTDPPYNAAFKDLNNTPTRADSLFLLNNNKVIEDFQKGKWEKQRNEITADRFKDWLRYYADNASSKKIEIQNEIDTYREDLATGKIDEDSFVAKSGKMSDYYSDKGLLKGATDWKLGGGEDKDFAKQYIHPNIKPQFAGELYGTPTGVGTIDETETPAVYSFAYDDLAITPWDMLNEIERIERVKKYGVEGTPFDTTIKLPTTEKSRSAWGTIIDLERSASSLAREKERDATEAKMKELKAAGLYDGPIKGRGAKDNKEWQEALANYNKPETSKPTKEVETSTKKEKVELPEGYSYKQDDTRDGDMNNYFFTNKNGSKKRISREEFIEATGYAPVQFRERHVEIPEFRDGGQLPKAQMGINGTLEPITLDDNPTDNMDPSGSGMNMDIEGIRNNLSPFIRDYVDYENLQDAYFWEQNQENNKPKETYWNPNSMSNGGELPKAQDGVPKVKQRRGVRNNPDGSVSSHLMKAEYVDGRGWVGFPSLFQDSKPYADDSQNWVDMSEEEDWIKIYEEAERRGEVYDFGEDKEAALAFGMGSWKDQLPEHLQNNQEYEDVELTDEEIKEYRDGGHVVEELSKAHYGGDLPEHYHPHMNDPSKEKYYSTLDEKFANEKQNWNNYLDHPFYQQNAQTAWGDDAALNIQKQKDRIDKLDIGYENNYFMDRLHGSGVKGVFHTPKEEGGRGNITMRKSPSSSELHTIGHEIGHGTDMSPETIEGSAYEKAMYPEFSGYYPENLSLNSGYSKYYDPNNKGDPEFKEYLEDPTEFRTRLNHTKGVMIEDNFNWNEKSGEEISEWLEQNNHNYNSYHDLSGNNRMMLGTDALEEVDQISKYNYIKPIKYSDFMGDDYKDYANEDWRKAKGKDGNKVYKKAWKKGIRTPEQWWDRFQTNFNDDPELKKQFLEDKDGDGEPDLQLQKSLDTYGPEQDPKFLEHVFKKLAQEQSTPNEGQLPTAQIGKSNFLNLTPEEKENAFNYVQELKAKEVQRNLQDIKTIKAQQFLSNMTRSPLFEERMKKQTGKTPGAGQADNYAEEIRNNIKTLKYRDFNDPKQQSYIAANFKDDTIKPSAYYTPRSSDSYDWIDNLRYAAGNPWYTDAVANEHKVTIPYGDDYEDALAIHETSHGSTNANRNLPIRPEGMPEMTPKAQALYGALPGGNEWIDYYHDPTEQKARVDVIRHELKKAGIYDAFNEPFTEDTYLKAKKHVLSLPSSHLKTNMLDILHNYKKEDAVELMNSFVQNKTENEGQLPTAQDGASKEIDPRVIEQNTKFQEKKDFLTKMANSSLFGKRYKTMSGNPDLTDDEIEEYRNVILNNIETMGVQPYFPEEGASGQGYYVPDPNTRQLKYINKMLNSDKPGDKEFAESMKGHTVNAPFGRNSLLTHEGSHGSTKASQDLRVQDEPIEQMDPYIRSMLRKKYTKYLEQPTEQKARIDVLREFMLNNDIHDVVNEEVDYYAIFKAEQYIKNHRDELNKKDPDLLHQLHEILKYYTNPAKLMNSFVQNETENEGSIPTAQLGMEYEEKELTDFEIAKLRKGGYVVEELPMAQTGEETEPNMVHRNANWAAKVRAGLPIEFANYNDDQIRELYENQNIVGAEPYGDEMIASFQLPELEILPGRQHELPYYKDLPEHTKQIIRESNIPTPPEIIAEYGYDPWSSKHNPMLRSALWAANDGPFNLYDRLVIPAMIMQGVAKADQIYRVPQALAVEAYEAYHGRPYDFSNVNPFTETNKSNMRRPSDIMEGGKQLDKYGQEELSWSGLAADVLADPFIISGANKLANRGIQGLTKKLVSNVSKKRYTNASKNAKFFDDFERNVDDVFNKGPEATWYDDAARTADDVSVNTKRLQSKNVPAVTEPNLPTQRPERPLVRQEPTERNLWDDMQEVGLPDEFAYDPFVDPATGNTLRVNVPETGLPAAPQTNIESAWDFISGNDPSRNTLNIKSTKKGSPLEKQLNKNSEININTLKNFINKKDVPEADKFIMNKVIEDKFEGVKNINYDEFKQAVSDEIVPLNTYETPQHAKVGVDPLGIYDLDDISIEEITGVKENVLSTLGLIKDKIKMLENPFDYKPKNMNDNPMSPSIITTPIGQKLHYGTDSYHEFNRQRLNLETEERMLDDIMKRTWYPDLGMSEEMFNRRLLEDMERHTKRIDHTKAALAKFNKPMHANNINKRQIQREKQGLKRGEEKLIKLEKRIAGDVGTIKKNTSLTFENLHEFGKGSGDHFHSAPLGHARTLVTNEEPNILHILENQSDWVQHGGLERSKKLLDPNPKKIKHLEEQVAQNEETLRRLKEGREKYLAFLADLKAGVVNEAERTAWIKNNDIVHEHEIEKFKQQIYDPTIRDLASYKANLKNPEQKVFLGKKLSERQLQETVAKAAKEGQTVVRIPTPETAVKIQGFTKRTLPDKAKRMEIEAEIVEIKAEMAVAKEKLDAGTITQKKYDEGLKESKRYLREANHNLSDAEYISEHHSIINKYKNGPKTVKKTFGLKTKEVTDSQGNTWYEFDIPESYINQEAEIIAFSEPATVSRSKAPKRTDPAYKGEGIYNFQDDLRAYQENKVGRKKPSYEDIDLDALDDAYNNMTDFKNAANELKRQKAIEIEDFMLDYVRAERPRMLANNKKVTKKLNEYIKRLDTKEGTERIRNQILEAPEGTPIHQMLEEQVSRMDPTLTGIEESNALNNIVDNMVNYYKGEVKKIKAMGHASTEYIRNVDNGDTRAWASRSKDGEVMEMYVGEGRLESEIDQVLEHEIGHVFGLVNNKAMKISTGIDKELSGLELVMTPDEAANVVKNNKGTKLTKDILYFKGQGQNNNTYNEATPYLAEVRQVLLDNNYIPDIYSPISKEMIKELYTEHSLFPKHNTTMGIRLFEIIKDTDKNMNIITKNINKLLGIPLAFLAGEAAAQESEETNGQPNKQMFLNPRRGKGKKNYKFKEGGAYEERELTPFEITELRARGYRVDVM